MLRSMPAVDALGLVGTTVEPIRFDACVDSGGFGLVYRARHLALDTDVAVKCLRISHLGQIDEAIRASIFGRFRDETKILYRLSQGCLDIVRCIGSGELVAPLTREHTPYMILEWLEGCSLSADLRQRRERGMPGRTLQEAIGLLDSAVGALAYAHGQGVIHRDIKPGNLFLAQTPTGVRMKVLDFGLAKILADEAIGIRPSVETGVGVHFCSPSYGAPEQFNSQIGPVGPWTDVYSLTLVLLELMKGQKIRPASNLAEGLLAAIDPQRGSPRASALGLRVSRAVDDLLARGVAQAPLERPRDAGVYWSALKELAAKADMAATVADADVAAAMERVRAAQGAHRAPAGGTMLMAPQPAPSQFPPPDPTPIPETAKMPQRPTMPGPLPAPVAAPKVRIESVPPARSAPPPRSANQTLTALVVFFAIVIVGGGAVVWWALKLR
jgi:serine/threonine protein kinase